MSKIRIIVNLIILVLLSLVFTVTAVVDVVNYTNLYIGIAFGVFAALLAMELIMRKTGPAT